MANYIYSVTVASGNLYGGGTGNVFYLDGARNSTGPGTVSWVNGGTLRFDQSDNTNDGHPLIFSTTTGTGGIISSGVTYYLDGSSNQANYTNTTTFNAATTRYVEVTPSSETDFYYLCYVHGIGMGGIFDITQNTWGALTWNLGNWGDTSSAGASVTGLSTSLSLGDLAYAASSTGWGALEWSKGAWGKISDSGFEFATGVSASMSIGDLSFAGASEGWGRPSWNLGAWGITGDVLAAGFDLPMSIGSVTAEALVEVGWGRGGWGNRAWGETYSVLPTGQVATISQTSVVAKTDVSISVSGLDLLTITQGLNSIQIDNNVTVFVGEDALQTTAAPVSGVTGVATVDPTTAGLASISTGQVVAGLKTPVDVTGISTSLNLGSTSLTQTTVESVTGQALGASLGTLVPIPGQIIGASGLTVTSAIGNVTLQANANIPVTGLDLTTGIGSVNITAWSEINPGVNNSWTEVDRAA